jgi:hypothetical protein
MESPYAARHLRAAFRGVFALLLGSRQRGSALPLGPGRGETRPASLGQPVVRRDDAPTRGWSVSGCRPKLDKHSLCRSDSSILLDTHAPRAREAAPCWRLAELIKSPEHVHTFV